MADLPNHVPGTEVSWPSGDFYPHSCYPRSYTVDVPPAGATQSGISQPNRILPGWGERCNSHPLLRSFTPRSWEAPD